MQSFVGLVEEDSEEISFLVQPALDLDHDLTWTADARLAKPTSVTVPDRKVRPALIDIGYQVEGEFGSLGSSLWTDSFDGLYTAQAGPRLSSGFFATLTSEWGVPGAGNTFQSTPTVYKVLDQRSGVFWNGYRKAVRDRDLATVRQRFNAQADRSAYTFVTGFQPDIWSAISAGWD